MLLPAPFGPIRQRSSPSASEKSMLRTACTPPKCLLSPRVSMRARAHALPSCGSSFGRPVEVRRSDMSHGTRRSVTIGATPFGTRRTKTSRMAPSTTLALTTCLRADFAR